MNNKKIVAGLLALTFVLGGAALPNKVVSNNAVILASAEEETEVLTFGDYKYTLLEDGTVEIAKYIGSDTVVEIPDEIDGVAVTSIGEHAFSNPYIKSIDVPDSVTVIESGAFMACWDLESISLPKNLEYIGRSAFCDCRTLKSIVIPDGVKTIGSFAFCECSGIESIVIPDSVETIENNAFSGCKSLKNITLPEGLKEIKEETFFNCNSLESIVIPDSVESIGGFIFANCFKLKSVTISAGVTKISNLAFYYYDPEEEKYKILEDVTINCYANSAAEKFAIANNLNYKLIDEKLPNCPPPKRMVIKAEYSSEYHQIRLRWKPYENAEKYGIAVYLAGKWRVWTCSIPADVTVFTSPKNLTPGTEYKIAVAARVNGNWNVRDAIYDAVKVTVK